MPTKSLFSANTSSSTSVLSFPRSPARSVRRTASSLAEAKDQFERDLVDYADISHDLVDLTISESFPASDPGELSPRRLE